jgi:hypothetical protein
MSNLDRRTFLRHASSTALTLPLLVLGIAELTGCARATGVVPRPTKREAPSPPGAPLVSSLPRLVKGKIARAGN